LSATCCAHFTNYRNLIVSTINLDRVPDLQTAPLASEEALEECERRLEKALQRDLSALLRSTDGFHSETVLIYGTNHLPERNRTFEVDRYCLGFIAIGDDGGGRAILLRSPEVISA
jgi:hypothetical protein